MLFAATSLCFAGGVESVTSRVAASLKVHGDGGRGSAAFLTKAARFSRLFRPQSSHNCMRCGRCVLDDDCVMVQPTFAARAAGFAQQCPPSNAEQHCCLNPVTAVGCACFADICMSEQHGRACMSHALHCSLYSCYMYIRRERADLLLSAATYF